MSSILFIGYCSDLTQRRFCSEGCQTLVERIELLCHPGAKEGGKPHTGLTPFGATGAATDFAGNNQGTNTALREIVVGRNSRNRHTDKEFWQEPFHTLA